MLFGHVVTLHVSDDRVDSVHFIPFLASSFLSPFQVAAFESSFNYVCTYQEDSHQIDMLKPVLTQPWMIRYDTWLSANDDIVGDMAEQFMGELVSFLGTTDFNRELVLDRFLKFVYSNSSSARKSDQRWLRQDHGLGVFLSEGQ